MKTTPPNNTEKVENHDNDRSGIRIVDKLVPYKELGLPEHITVISKISQGGMGVVLKGLHKSTGRYLAIKLLLPNKRPKKRILFDSNEKLKL